MTPFDANAYVDAAAAALDLPIPPGHRDAIAANLARLRALAQDVLAFEIPARGGDEAHGDLP
jgi:hypothetical protein